MAPVRKNNRASKRTTLARATNKPTATANGFTLPPSQPQKVVTSGRRRKSTAKGTKGYTPKKNPTGLPTKSQPRRGAKTNRKKWQDEDTIYAESSLPALTSDTIPPVVLPQYENGDEEYQPSSPPPLIYPLLPPQATTPTALSAFLTTIDPDIHALATTLHTSALSGQTQMELPELSAPQYDPITDLTTSLPVPWKSKQLFHMYILGYAKGYHHVCDLIVDTWIREFHKLDDVKGLKIWRENIHRFVDDRATMEEDHATLGSTTDNGDANICIHATSFSASLLDQLFTYTPTGCGARNLWADAMALVGSPLENILMKQGGREAWNQELVWEIMMTSLRLSRVHRTLKVEERWVGAWCERYHEHGKCGERCYRVVAREEVDGEKTEDEEDEEDEEEGSEGVGEEGRRKVSFGDVDVFGEGE